MNSLKMIRILVVSVIALFAVNAHAQSADAVNNFYKNLKATVSSEPISVKSLITLVKNDRASAEKCLAALKQKYDAAPEAQKDSYRFLYEQLLGGTVLASTSANCDQNVTKALTAMLKMQPDNEDKIIILGKLTEICPQSGPELYAELGDRLFHEGQFGVAVEAYKKSLEKRNDEGVRQALKMAQEAVDRYVTAKAPSDLTDEFGKIAQTTMAPMPGSIRKVVPPRSVQLNRIQFDEWSYKIKDESLPLLQQMGKSIKDNMSANPRLSVSIEGHTDNRGQYDKNLELSRSRAEAIKKYFVDSFQIDPNRILVTGYGPDKPFSAENNETGWAQNRRVEFRIPESTK